MIKYRELVMRCPRLGGEVSFAYCEQEAGDLPCRQTIRCWESSFPVESHLRGTLAPASWERFCGQAPRDRIATLIDMVEAVRQRQEGDLPPRR